MSEETLQRFLERLNTDASFRESVHANPESAFAEFELSPAEQAALTSGDEDALRRLIGNDLSGYALDISRSFSSVAARRRSASRRGASSIAAPGSAATRPVAGKAAARAATAA